MAASGRRASPQGASRRWRLRSPRSPMVARARRHQAEPTSPLGPSGSHDTAPAHHFHLPLAPRQGHPQLLKKG